MMGCSALELIRFKLEHWNIPLNTLLDFTCAFFSYSLILIRHRRLLEIYLNWNKMSGRVLIYGGKGALGSVCVNFFKSKNFVSFVLVSCWF